MRNSGFNFQMDPNNQGNFQICHLYVCKQAFCISKVRIFHEETGAIMRHLRETIFCMKTNVLQGFHISISEPLMNDFDEIFVFAQCDKENMLIFNACSSLKKMLSNLACVLMIYSLISATDVCSRFCKTCRNIYMTEVLLRKLVSRVATFLNEALLKMTTNMTNITTAKCDSSKK